MLNRSYILYYIFWSVFWKISYAFNLNVNLKNPKNEHPYIYGLKCMTFLCVTHTTPLYFMAAFLFTL